MNDIFIKSNQKNLSWLLVKNRLSAQLGVNVFKYEKNRRKRNNKIMLMISIIILVVVFAVYSGTMAYGYAYLGLAELIPSVSLVLCSLIILFFTMFKAKGELFGFKDYDILMSLPIPVKTVINSRFFNMYFWNILFSIVIMLPMGLVYGVFTKAGIGFYIIWLAGLFLAGLIPTTFAAIFGAIITSISSKFKYKSAIATILSLLLVIVIMVLPTIATSSNFAFGGMIDPNTGNIDSDAFSEIAPAISERLNRAYPPARLFTQAVVGGNYVAFILFAVISIVWYALFIQLLSLKYREINTAVTSHASRADYKLEALNQGNMLTALYKKTILRILKSTVAATNLLVGCLLAVLLSAAMLIVGPEKVIQGLDFTKYMPIIANVACYVIAAMISMTNTAVVSLALEGRNIWIIKSLPISPKTLYDSYLLTNLTFTVPTSLICSLLVSLSLKLGVAGTILMVTTPLIFALFTAVAGVFIGNRMAFYDWKDEVHVVKQSLMSFIGMLGGTVLIFICGIIANSGIILLSANIITLIFNILFLVLTAVLYFNESKRPIKE